MPRAWWVCLALFALGRGGTAAVSPPKPKPRPAPQELRVVVPRPADVDTYLKLLKSPHPNERAHAAFHLADRGQWAAAAIPDLAEMLDDWDDNTKTITGIGPSPREATRALVAIGPPALDAVIPLLSDKRDHIRSRAAEIICRIGGPRAGKALLAHLDGTDRYVRSGILQALRTQGARPSPELLLPLLSDSDPQVRGQAAEALGRTRDPRAVAPLMARLGVENDCDVVTASGWNTVVAVERGLFELGAPAVGPLLEAVRSSDTTLRGRAMMLLGLMDDPRANEWRLAALDDPDPSVRAAAVRAYARPSDTSEMETYLVAGRAAPLVDRRALPGLLRALKRNDVQTRAAAAAALGHLGTRGAVSALLAAREDGSLQVRRQALIALAETDDPRARQAVLAAFRDPDLEQAAVWAVKSNRCRYAAENLIAIVADTSREKGQRALAADALRDTADPAALPALREVLRTGDPWLRGAAAAALGAIGNQAARDLLLSYAKESDPQLNALGISGLSRVREPRAFDLLLAALASDQLYLRVYAAQGLGRIRDRRATRPLLEAFKRSTGMEGRQLRWAVLEALGKIGDRSAVPSLIWILDHYHAAYRPQAAAALKQITGRDLGENPLVWRAWWEVHNGQQGGQ